MASTAVVWDVLRNHDAFLVRKDGVSFSRDPLNLTNKHSYAASGVSQPKAVGINLEARKTKKGGSRRVIVLSTKSKKVRDRSS